jgi:hypothetical protein
MWGACKQQAGARPQDRVNDQDEDIQQTMIKTCQTSGLIKAFNCLTTHQLLFIMSGQTSSYYNLSDLSNDKSRLQGQRQFQQHERRVRFAAYSELRLVSSTSWYHSEKAYTKKQLRLFKASAARDAQRIRALISRQLDKHASIENATHHVMGCGFPHLIGIEHLISGKAARDKFYERPAHIAAVLDAQKLLQEKCHGKDFSTQLAKFASLSSYKSTKAAVLEHHSPM